MHEHGDQLCVGVPFFHWFVIITAVAKIGLKIDPENKGISWVFLHLEGRKCGSRDFEDKFLERRQKKVWELFETTKN